MTTRRASALAIAAPAAAIAPSDADAELLRLIELRSALKVEAAQLSEAQDAAFTRAVALFPPVPDALTIRPDDWFRGFRHGKRMVVFDEEAVASWRKALDEGNHRSLMSDGQRARFESRGREVIDAYDAYVGARQQAELDSGFRQAEAAWDQACQAVYEVEDAALRTPAKTLPGCCAKAQIVAELVGDGDGSYEDRAVRSLLADLVSPT